MAYIDHIQACNNYDLSKFVPFFSPDEVQIGYVREDHLLLLTQYKDVLSISGDAVRLKPLADLTAAMRDVSLDLKDKGLISGWRDEQYVVSPSFLQEPLFLIERAATSFFGIRAYGVHINGYVRNENSLKMWVAKRAIDRAICPGMLDNMVAGGQPAGLSLSQNIIKECHEEANVPEALAAKTVPVGCISYMMETENGIKPDLMYCYDLEVPENFVPENTDGEVESFTLMDIQEVAEIVRTTFDFKFNCNLVIIDFLIRHGVINPDKTEDYEQLVSGLRG